MKTTRFETTKDGVSCLWNTSDHLPHPWTRSEYDRRARYAVEALTEIDPKWGARAKHILIDVADGPQEGVPTNQYDRGYCHLYALWATQHEGYDRMWLVRGSARTAWRTFLSKTMSAIRLRAASARSPTRAGL